MAFKAKTGSLALRLAGALVVSTLALAAPAETRRSVSLEEASARQDVSFKPALEGENVTVRGVVSSNPAAYPFYSHLAIQDEAGYGLVLEGPPAQFRGLRAGQRIEARGVISKRAGLVVLLPSNILVLSSGPAPAAERTSPASLQSFRHLGVLVTTEGRVVDKGESPEGEYLLIGEARRPLRVLLPVAKARTGSATLDRFENGDSVRVTGVAAQYCPFAPYDRHFQVVVSQDDDIVLVRKRWLVSPEWLAVSLAFLVFALGVWWVRERRLRAQRQMVRTFYSLGEELIGVSSPLEVLSRLNAVLPELLQVFGVHLYLHNRTTRTLERVARSAEGALAIPVAGGEGSLPLGPAACFQNQALLTIPDTRRSPFFPDGRSERQPGSVMFVPMFAEAGVLGVLELYDDRPEHEFTRDDRVLTQHLGNQIGIALRLVEEKSVREQLYRSEKLAAVGQLMSGIASELRAPLESISELAESVTASPLGTLRGDIQAISTEARKAAEIVSRLVSFVEPERAEAKRIELNGLLRSLIEFRRPELSARGIQVREVLSPSPVHILGSQGQLERVFLDLLVQAEHALLEAPEKILSIATTVLARRGLVEVEYSGSGLQGWEGALARAEAGVHAEGVSRGIVHSHGGELRVTQLPQGRCRLEIEFPLAPARLAADGTGVARAFTCLIVEPDQAKREELVRTLTQRGSRVIPAATAEEGAELVQRLRFDIVFCALRLPGLNWIEFSESIRPQIGGFVLLTEGFDYELSRGLLNAESYVLNRPFVEADLERILAAVENRLASPESRFQVWRAPDRSKAAGGSF